MICFACRYRFVWVQDLSFKLTPCAVDILPFLREGPSSDRQSKDSIAEIFGRTWYEVIETWRLVDKFPWTTFSAKFQGLELCNGGEIPAKPSWVGWINRDEADLVDREWYSCADWIPGYPLNQQIFHTHVHL